MIALMMLVISATSTWHGTEAFCPFKCHCDDQKMKVICTSEANLDIIPITLNPGIKEIHLRENQIRTVDASFQFYGQLEFVDFSNNQMAELPDRCFAKQSKLTHLTMDFNQIANVTNTTFQGLRSLTHLSLRGNRLTSLDGQAFGMLDGVRNRSIFYTSKK
jgi:Leucine-rich repeat (LRR) protein